MIWLVLAVLLVAAGLLVRWGSRRTAWWRSTVDYKHPRIIMYHMIGPTERSHKFRGLRVAPAMFERQLAWLKQQGWTFVTMRELYESLGNHPPKTVAITFDDGFEDNYTNALPILRKYDAKATLYLVVDRHGNDWQVKRKAHHDSGEIAREPKLSDEQVREMIGSGLIEIGGHTLTHANLSKEDAETKRGEIGGCRHALEAEFDIQVTSFAYPFGIFDDQDVAIVREAGYTTAVTVLERIDAEPADLLRLSRVKASGKDSFADFKVRMRTGVRG